MQERFQIDGEDVARIVLGLVQRVETLEKQVSTYLNQKRRLLGAEHADVVKVQKLGESPR